MLVPAPPLLTEIPAVILLVLWWLLYVASFAVPRVTQPADIQLLWGLVASFAVGAIASITRRPITW
jgi:hypothetical protein